MDLKKYIRDIKDFPIDGILFKDITTLLIEPSAFKFALEELYNFAKNKEITKVVGIESRGFIFGGALAEKLGVGFVPIRKPGKLPSKTRTIEYQLEYGLDKIQIHEDAILPTDKILIHDDLLATGGTINAAIKLIESFGADVSQISFIINLSFLNGLNSIKNYDVKYLVEY